ncbi:MAG: hypothetical protein PUP92_40085, partial [Rhizonema sp. PD38]|nr:hypothetical protein [Rhizonema sp. PD38]
MWVEEYPYAPRSLKEIQVLGSLGNYQPSNCPAGIPEYVRGSEKLLILRLFEWWVKMQYGSVKAKKQISDVKFGS